MGRGRSKVGTGGAKGSIELGYAVAEFEGTLRFGKKDSIISSAERATIEPWEKKRVKNKVEYGFAVYADGTPIGPEVRGGKTGVRTPISYHMADGGTFTHIHPRSNGDILGGTFSPEDLSGFARTAKETMRAAAKEGTYSISKTASFDKSGFTSYMYSENNRIQKQYRDEAYALNNAYTNGKMTYDEYFKKSHKAFNTMLVRSHDSLLAGQKKYGYYYTLEKR